MTDVVAGRDFPHVGASPGFIALCFYKKFSIWFGEGVRQKISFLLKNQSFPEKRFRNQKSLGFWEKVLVASKALNVL